jgi:hypothetical protein
MTAPQWSPVDDDTADLLHLVRDEGHFSADHEWTEFVTALRFTAAPRDGLVDPNAVRELLRGVVAPRRIGAFYQAAIKADLIRPTGEWVVSTDTAGRNSGKPCRT